MHRNQEKTGQGGKLARLLTAALGLGVAAISPVYSATLADDETPPAPETPVDEPDRATEPVTAEERLVATLRALRVDDPPEAESLVPALAEATREVPDRLFDILTSRRVPPLADEGPQTLSIAQEGLALEALATVGRGATLTALATWESDHRPGARRATRVRVVGAVGGAGDLDLLFRYAFPPEVEELEPRVGDAVEAAVVDVLARDAGGFVTLQRTWRDLRPELVAPTIEAVGATEDPAGLRLFIDVVARREDLAVLVMAQTRRIAPSPRREVDEALAGFLRPYLDTQRENHCRAACLALGQLQDVESAPMLIELLDAGNQGLRENAFWALGELSGLSLPSDPQVWRDWYVQETRWYQERRRAVLVGLTSPLSGTVSGAIREMTEHNLYRHEFATELGVVLESPREELRILACRALGELGSRWAAPTLVEVLEDPDEEVRAAAREALVQLTGRDLGEEVDDWRVELLGQL